jgi:4-amino-4-deoxy-L-arabinose transferase-like glycosyltransferase
MLNVSQLEAPAPIIRSRARLAPLPLQRHWHLLVLLVISFIGGAIRFTHLSQPCLWGDEASVFRRICGTYAQLIEQLRTDGFGPLHYEMHWVIAQFTKPTPTVLRLPSAICGTLQVLAMYVLARQLFARSTALLAAAFTACSGFMIFYSRDAKMYMETWCFTSIGVASLLWWFRTRTRWRSTAWLCWVAASATACGIHSASALPVIALSPLLLLTNRWSHWKEAVLLVVGLVVILAGPAGYYLKFNKFVDNADDDAGRYWGIGWVESYNRGMDGPQLVRHAATALGMGWAWPKATGAHWPNYLTEKDIPPAMLKWPKIAAEMLLSILIAAVLPWPRSLRPADQAGAPEPGWRVLLWLSLWIVLPGYLFYCHSVPDFESPILHVRWPAWFWDALAAHVALQYVFGSLLAATVILGTWFRPTRPAVQKALVVAVMFGLVMLVFTMCRREADLAAIENRAWRSIWVPRYLGFIWPAMAMATAALLMRLPTIYIRSAAIALLLGVNAAFGIARFAVNTEPPVEQIARDVLDAQPPRDATTRTYTAIPPGSSDPGRGSLMMLPGRYYLYMLSGERPPSPQQFRMLGAPLPFVLRNYDGGRAVREVGASPRISRIVLWENEAFDADYQQPDALRGKLPPGWQLVSDRWYPVWTFWEWQQQWNFRRTEYVKESPDAGSK